MDRIGTALMEEESAAAPGSGCGGAAIRESVEPRPPPGVGIVKFERDAAATFVTRRFASSPLKLLTPRGAGGCAHVVTSTYGGGLLAGDEISLRVEAGARTRCVMGTQASTKMYRSGDGRTSRQSLDATVGRGAVLVVAPDPVTCFAGARYEQRQRFRLAGDASLLLIDWLTSGRAARGERWAFEVYRSETRIDIGPVCVARDALRLAPDDAPIDAPHRMGRFDCLASVYVLGPAFAAAATTLLERIARMPVERRAPLIAAASPLQDGVVLRVLGGAAEAVGRFLGQHLEPAWSALGEGPWSRKW
jgi:urease accessory protein